MEMLTITLSELEKKEILKKFSNLQSPYKYYYEQRGVALRGFISALEGENLTHFLNLKSPSKTKDCILLHNLPIEKGLPSTPLDGKRSEAKKTFVSEWILISISLLLGSPITFKNEKKGELVHQIAPVQENSYSFSNEGSKVDFLLHTEVAFHKLKPHFIALHCLRGDKNDDANTFILSASDFLHDLDNQFIDALSKPNFQIELPASFLKELENISEPDKWSDPLSIISVKSGISEVCLDLNGMKGMGAKSQRIVEQLSDILEKHSQKINVHLKAGDLIVINNRTAVHGRSKFHADFDGQDRWLQRIYIHSDIWADRNFKYLEDHILL